MATSPPERSGRPMAEIAFDRAVLLGASNLTRSISTVLGLLEQAADSGGLEVFAALGHGRSYGQTSRLLGRTLPGIVPSGLWPALESQPSRRTVALVTDIGNDLLYGASADQVADWVETCLKRLREQETEKIILTRLPLCNLAELSPARFRFFRAVMFPGRTLTLDEVRRAAESLDVRIGQLGADYAAELVEPRPDWYGLDPIHIRWHQWRRAWPFILNSLGKNRGFVEPRLAPLRFVRARLTLPQRCAFWGYSLERAQPGLRFANGTSLWLY